MYFHGASGTRAELEGPILVPVLRLANCDLGHTTPPPQDSKVLMCKMRVMYGMKLAGPV